MRKLGWLLVVAGIAGGLGSVAVAQDAPPATAPLPKFAVKAERTDLDDGYHSWWFQPRSDGCYHAGDPEIDEEPYYSAASGRCDSVRLRVNRGGHFSTLSFDKYGIASYNWSCSRAGRYTWRATYSNTSVPGYSESSPYQVSKTGTFSIPRCRARKPRPIAKGTVQAHENDASQASYKNEFISSIRCSPAGPVRNGKASKWRCDVTHNNNYRECTDHDRVVSYGADKYGLRDIGQSITTSGKSCRDF